MALIVRRRRFSMCYRARWQPCRSWCKRFGNCEPAGDQRLQGRTRDCCNGSIRRARCGERPLAHVAGAGDDTVRSVTGRIIGNSNGPLYAACWSCGNARWRSPQPRGCLWSGVIGRVASADARVRLISDSVAEFLYSLSRAHARSPGDNSRRPLPFSRPIYRVMAYVFKA